MPQERSRFAGPRELVVLTRGFDTTRSTAGMPVSPRIASLNSLLGRFGARMTPCFEHTAAAPLSPGLRERHFLESTTGRTLPRFYSVDVAEGAKDELAAQLRQDPLVEAAYVRPAPEPPVRLTAAMDAIAKPSPFLPVPPATTADYTSSQGYLEAAPGGVDARLAWTLPGGGGVGVNIIDVEGEWNFAHEDLVLNQGGMIGGGGAKDLLWRNHGTAVVGVIGADANTFGCTGIAPDARVRAVSVFDIVGGSAGAIRQGADALSPGDILLIELHFPGPRFGFMDRYDQKGYIAAEWWPDLFAAIVYATTERGVIVVEAAGNGAEDLDDPLYDERPVEFPAFWSNPFRTSNSQSGAILVGAGAPPPGTHGTTTWGPDRSRLDFSNYGARIDAQGWGREVTTTGYGDLAGDAENKWYTTTFSGTSSASPTVVGALACIQGTLRGAGRSLLTPPDAQALLRSTGSRQQDGPNAPTSERIGNRPDVRSALQSLGIGPADATVRNITGRTPDTKPTPRRKRRPRHP